jgi:hypothetical protein
MLFYMRSTPRQRHLEGHSRGGLLSHTALAAGLAILLAVPGARAQDDGIAVPDDGPDIPAVEIRDERLTLDADQIPLGTILSRLAAEAKITFELKDVVEEPMSAHMIAVPLDDGLQRLLKDRNTLFLYDAGARTPSVIYVLGRRLSPQDLPPRPVLELPGAPGRSGDVTPEEQDVEPGPEDTEARILDEIRPTGTLDAEPVPESPRTAP